MLACAVVRRPRRRLCPLYTTHENVEDWGARKVERSKLHAEAHQQKASSRKPTAPRIRWKRRSPPEPAVP